MTTASSPSCPYTPSFPTPITLLQNWSPLLPLQSTTTISSIMLNWRTHPAAYSNYWPYVLNVQVLLNFKHTTSTCIHLFLICPTPMITCIKERNNLTCSFLFSKIWGAISFVTLQQNEWLLQPHWTSFFGYLKHIEPNINWRIK